MTINEVRQQNIGLLSEQHGGKAALAKACNKTPGYISQLISGHRNLGEKAARDIEKALSLPKGCLDQQRTSSESAAFPAESWEGIGPEGQSVVLSLVNLLRINKGLMSKSEQELIVSFRACGLDAQAVILAVAKAQAASQQAVSK